MNIEDILANVQNNKIGLDEAARLIRACPYDDVDFAKLDGNRNARRGFGEVVYAPGKTCEQLVKIIGVLDTPEKGVLATRATPEQYAAVAASFPRAQYDAASRLIRLMPEAASAAPFGNVAVCTGGTGDIPVAEEAAQTAEFLGCGVTRFYDVGVAGIHRLFANLDAIKRANVIIAIAGMEGALAGVVAGLVDVPVIAVPTSVGYGASFEGIAPLLTMMNACAEGVAVVNIDNGFGAGYLAAQINRLIEKRTPGHA